MKIKGLVILIVLVLSSSFSFGAAPFTAITATVTDSDSQAWYGCQWSVTFIPGAQYSNPSVYNYNGVSITSPTYNSYLQQNGTCDGTGTFSVMLLDNVAVTPGGSTWRFTIQPNASVPATVYTSLSVTGSSMDLSSYLSTNSVAPRFAATGNGAYGYSDAEVSPSAPKPGGQYFNVVTSITRQWTGSIWQSIIGGTGSYLPISGGTLSGSLTDSFGFIGPVTGHSSLDLALTGGNPTGPINSSSVITASAVNGMLNATKYSGSDILAQVTAAFASSDCVSGNCTVYVPAGTYNSVTSTFEFNPSSLGRKALILDDAALINYTGTGWAITATSNCGASDAGIYITGGQINGTSSGLGGIQLTAFNGAVINKTRVYGFTNGDGINNNGANSVDIYGVHGTANKNGLHETSAFGCGPTTHVYGGGFEFNSSWGTLSDGSQPSSGDIFSGVNYVANGAAGATGNVLEFAAIKNLFSACYFEEALGSTQTYSVVIGDITNATANATSVTLRDNVFYSAGTHTASIFNNGSHSVIDSNWEAGTPTYFINQGNQETVATISNNSGFWSSSVWGGSDHDSITVLANNNGNAPVPLVNSYAPSNEGLGFNALVGQPSNDLRISCLNTATYATKWYGPSFTPLLGTMDCSGNFSALGTINSTAGYKYNGTSGFTGTKTAGACTLTIQGGIITNVAGC